MERWHELLEEERFRRLGALPFPEARDAVFDLLSHIADGLSHPVRALLPYIGDIRSFQPSQELVDRLDELGFDREDQGDLTGSDQAFSAARFASACAYLHGAASFADLMNALYEGRHSLQQKSR